MNLFLFVCFISVQKAFMQECRQVTVCDRDVGNAQKGEKGNMGNRGKAGSKGEIGEKGTQGESCALGDFESEIRNRLSDLENRLIPTSCLTSPVYGTQTLTSGMTFCDGGWTVFQRRINGSVNFQRNWIDYKNGFGDLSGEFWFGLEKLHQLTKGRGCRLRIDLWDFNNDHRFAIYSSFSVENESANYKLYVGGYSGTAGDSLTGDHVHNAMFFTTIDMDNDNSENNCATSSSNVGYGGWWFNSCFHASLNAPWGVSQGSWRNIVWNAWKGKDEALKATIMKLRCD